MHSRQPSMMVLSPFLMQFYSAPASNAKNSQIFQMGCRNSNFLFIKSQNFEKLYKIYFLKGIIVYIIPKYNSIWNKIVSVRAFSVFMKSARISDFFCEFEKVGFENTIFQWEKGTISKNFFNKSFYQYIFLYYIKFSWSLDVICNSYNVFSLLSKFYTHMWVTQYHWPL